MSARKIAVGSLPQQVTVEARQTRLTLSQDSVLIHKSGIEFRSSAPFSPWTELTLTLQSPRGDGPVHCNGAVISFTASKHTGYHRSMIFTRRSRAAQARLTLLLYSDE